MLAQETQIEVPVEHLLTAPLEKKNSKPNSKTSSNKKEKSSCLESHFGLPLPTELQGIFKEAPKPKSSLSSLFKKETMKDRCFEKDHKINESDLVMQDEEYLRKKVRIDTMGFSPSTQDDGSEKCTSPPTKLTSDSVSRRLLEGLSGDVGINGQSSHGNSPVKLKNYGNRKIVEVASEAETEKLLFKVERRLEKDNKDVVPMSREEILKEDPMLLVYFYESHLQFTKTKDFCPETLKKLQGFK